MEIEIDTLEVGKITKSNKIKEDLSSKRQVERNKQRKE